MALANILGKVLIGLATKPIEKIEVALLVRQPKFENRRFRLQR